MDTYQNKSKTNHNEQFDLKTFFVESQYKYRTYQFLNNPNGFFSIGYQMATMTVVMACVVLTMVFSKENKIVAIILIVLDIVMLVTFFLELIIRTWASTCFDRYKGFIGTLRLILSPWFFIDLLVIILTLSVLFFNAKDNILSVCLRGFRLLHFFQNRYGLWSILWGVMWIQRFQLAVCAYILLVMLFVVSFIIYYVEVDNNDKINNVIDSVWFTLVTFSTVGYGDVVPVSKAGKIIIALSMVLGVGVFSLPGGVIGAGLALKIDSDTKNRTNNFRRSYAAMLIQNTWRVYSFECKYYQNKLPTRVMFQTSPTQTTNRLKLGRSKGPKFMAYGHRVLAHIPPLAVLFIYKLRFCRAKYRFHKSIALCDENSFYETYTNNQWENTELIRTLDLKLNHIQQSIDEQREFFSNLFLLLSSNKKLSHLFQDDIPQQSAVASHEEDEWNAKIRDLSLNLAHHRKYDSIRNKNAENICACCRRQIFNQLKHTLMHSQHHEGKAQFIFNNSSSSDTTTTTNSPKFKNLFKQAKQLPKAKQINNTIVNKSFAEEEKSRRTTVTLSSSNSMSPTTITSPKSCYSNSKKL